MMRVVVIVIGILGFAIGIVNALPIPSFLVPRSAALFCLPASWDTVILFYLFNYFAHAATVKSSPGDTWRHSFSKTILALLFPFSGIWSACIAISRSRFCGESKLDHALRVQALCCVVRTHLWRPQPGTTVFGCHTSGITSTAEGGFQRGMLRLNPLYDAGQQPIRVSPATHNIQGQANLPMNSGYELQIVPRYVRVAPLNERPRVYQPGEYYDLNFCSSHNVLKCTVSILQLVFSALTLYRSQGQAIDRFGYAAYGLTVIPYAIMSLLNLIANITTPDYPFIYIIRSEVMEEAESRGARFDGIIGKILMPEDRGQSHDLPITTVGSDPQDRTPSIEGFQDKLATGVEICFWDPGDLEGDVKNNPTVTIPAAGQYVFRALNVSVTHRENLAGVIGMVAVLAPWAIIGGMTMFGRGSSTAAQRGWILGWLVCGEVFGVCLGYLFMYGGYLLPRQWKGIDKVLLLVICAVPVVGGAVVVGQMLWEFGTCVVA